MHSHGTSAPRCRVWLTEPEIVPTPLVTPNLTPRVSIATASSSSNDTTTHPSPVGGGPTSASYVVPPRPKPGRKPATDEPASKRKAQNRESQRAFRARKAAKLNEMQAQVETTESKHRDTMNKKIAELHEKEMRIKELESLLAQSREAEKRVAQERDFWKDRCTQDHEQIQMPERHMRDSHFPMLNPFTDKPDVLYPNQLPPARQESPTRSSVATFTGYNTPTVMDIGCGKCTLGGECACIAELAKIPTANPFMAPVPLIRAPKRSSHSPTKGPEVRAVEVYADREIDFTAQFAKRKVQRPSIAFMTDGSDGSRCGFCTDDSNCLCNDKTLQNQESHHAADGEAKMSIKSGVVNGPGSCADCQSNPQQRAWCQRVAQLRGSDNDFLPSPSSRTSSVGSVLETMEPHISDASMVYEAKSSIGCCESFKLFEGRLSMDQDKMDWIGSLKPKSHDRRDTLIQAAKKYSALEIDTAGIIATLGKTMQPIQSRPSDGDNAPLVRVAQEIQRATQSPRPGSESSLEMPSIAEGFAAPMDWR